MDIRSEDDYNIGHIPGAVKSTLGTIVADAAAADNPIVVVCYTGQTAGHAVVALRLSGFSDARVLMFGMASWHADFAGPWNSNIGDVGVGHTNWSTDVSEPTPETYAYPEINTTATDGAAILAERVAVLTAGFNGIENTTVLDNPGDYFINNYWGIDDWEHYGHIEGAYRLNPLSLENINHVNPERTIVTYCYTGQTSSMITAYLKVLGYDALSLLFGTNGMIHSVMESHQWTTETPAGFEVE
jgi:rhodanese-related sulfurtransferase